MGLLQGGFASKFLELKQLRFQPSLDATVNATLLLSNPEDPYATEYGCIPWSMLLNPEERIPWSMAVTTHCGKVKSYFTCLEWNHSTENRL